MSVDVHPIADVSEHFSFNDIPDGIFEHKFENDAFYAFNAAEAGCLIGSFRKRMHVISIDFCAYACRMMPELYNKNFHNVILAAAFGFWNYEPQKLNESLDASSAVFDDITKPEFYADVSSNSFEADWLKINADVNHIKNIYKYSKIPFEEIPEDMDEIYKNQIKLYRDALFYSIMYAKVQTYRDNIFTLVAYLYAVYNMKTASDIITLVKTFYNYLIPQTEFTQILVDDFNATKRFDKEFVLMVKSGLERSEIYKIDRSMVAEYTPDPTKYIF